MRKYDASTRRAAAEATRDRICAAAEELFLRDGYARTSIKRVAKQAGVAEATVYLASANKAALLDATIIRATRFETPEIVDLPSFAAAQAALLARAAPIIALGEAAALMDAELRPHRERAHANLRAMFARLAAGRRRRGPDPLRDLQRDHVPAPRPAARRVRRVADRDAQWRFAFSTLMTRITRSALSGGGC